MIRLRHIASSRLEPDQNHADAAWELTPAEQTLCDEDAGTGTLRWDEFLAGEPELCLFPRAGSLNRKTTLRKQAFLLSLEAALKKRGLSDGAPDYAQALAGMWTRLTPASLASLTEDATWGTALASFSAKEPEEVTAEKVAATLATEIACYQKLGLTPAQTRQLTKRCYPSRRFERFARQLQLSHFDLTEVITRYRYPERMFFKISLLLPALMHRYGFTRPQAFRLLYRIENSVQFLADHWPQVTEAQRRHRLSDAARNYIVALGGRNWRVALTSCVSKRNTLLAQYDWMDPDSAFYFANIHSKRLPSALRLKALEKEIEQLSIRYGLSKRDIAPYALSLVPKALEAHLARLRHLAERHGVGIKTVACLDRRHNENAVEEILAEAATSKSTLLLWGFSPRDAETFVRQNENHSAVVAMGQTVLDNLHCHYHINPALMGRILLKQPEKLDGLMERVLHEIKISGQPVGEYPLEWPALLTLLSVLRVGHARGVLETFLNYCRDVELQPRAYKDIYFDLRRLFAFPKTICLYVAIQMRRHLQRPQADAWPGLPPQPKYGRWYAGHAEHLRSAAPTPEEILIGNEANQSLAQAIATVSKILKQRHIDLDTWIAGGEKRADLENLAELAEELAPYWRQIQAIPG